jgi:protein-S-isoprenylcysteine O-methyltransferase Ste14
MIRGIVLGFVALGMIVLLAIAAFELWPSRMVFSRDDRLSGLLIVLSLMAVALVAICFPGHGSGILEVCGLATGAGGLGLRLAAMHTLGSSYSYGVRVPDALCARGVYRCARHPAYLGSCLYVVAAPLYFGSVAAVALVPLALLAILYRARLEEELLDSSLLGYSAYRQQTSALIPFLF